MPRTANEWLYPRKNHNHNHNVDLGALGTAPKKTRRSLRRNWNSLPSSETLASHADVRSSSVVTRVWGYWNTQDEKIAKRAVQLATLQTFDGSCFWLLTVQGGTLLIYNHIEVLWFSTYGRGWVGGKLLSEVYLEDKSGVYNNEISSFEFILKFWHSTFRYIWQDFWALPSNRSLPSYSVFFRLKTTISKVAIIRNKIASIAFFSSSPFFLLALSFSPFLFLR